MEKLGLTQRCITTPVTFRATPITEAFSILLQRNIEKHNKIQAKAEKIIKNFKEQNNEKPTIEDTQYRLTAGANAESHQYLRDMAEIQTSKDTIGDWKQALQWTDRHFEAVKQSSERGVKRRYITHIPEGEKIPQFIQNLMKMGSFKIKHATTLPKASIDILDKKSVHIITTPNSNLNDVKVLRINDPAVVELAQDYFDMKWKTATAPCWRKKNNALET